jgi:predicted GH43/DUF377 family glycosyl hydrolase
MLFACLITSITITGCSFATESPNQGEPDQDGNIQAVVEAGLPPSLRIDDSFELVYDSTLEDTFARTAGVEARPLMLTSQGGLFFLILDFAPHSYFPLQGGSELRIAVSTDGREWAFSDQPVFSFANGQQLTFQPYSMLQMPDGSYSLYGAAKAESIETLQTWASQYAILRATTSNPMEGWTIEAEPLLLPGDAYSWDRSVVWSPYVFAEAGAYRMYYWGQPNTDFNADNGIGMAFSEDGVDWRKDLPVEGGQADRETNLLLSRSQDEWVEIILLHIWRTVDGWQLMYYLRDRRDSGLPHLAFSQDGVEWTPVAGDIQLPASTMPDDIVYASLTYAQGQYWMMYCVGIDNTFCYLARTE